MIMRYRGCGIGHTYTREIQNRFEDMKLALKKQIPQPAIIPVCPADRDPADPPSRITVGHDSDFVSIPCWPAIHSVDQTHKSDKRNENVREKSEFDPQGKERRGNLSWEGE